MGAVNRILGCKLHCQRGRGKWLREAIRRNVAASVVDVGLNVSAER